MKTDQNYGIPDVAKVACKTCPYRLDVPAGIWAREEYLKLPAYDGEIIDQIGNGGTRLFLCHQQNGKLCSGWIGCHGPENLVALRLHEVKPEVFSYESPVLLFSSGAQAATHGLSGVEKPDEQAQSAIKTLLRKQNRRQSAEL